MTNSKPINPMAEETRAHMLQMKQNILDLMAGIKLAAGAIRVLGCDCTNEPLMLLYTMTGLAALSGDVSITERDSAFYRYELTVDTGNIQYMAIGNMEDIRQIEQFRPAWEKYCSINNLCPVCGTEKIKYEENGSVFEACPNHRVDAVFIKRLQPLMVSGGWAHGSSFGEP